MQETLTLASMVLGGLLAHLFGKMRELRKTEKTLTMARHIKAKPYQLGYSVVAAAITAVALNSYGELTPITAIGCGYMCDSVLDKITDRTTKALR